MKARGDFGRFLFHALVVVLVLLLSVASLAQSPQEARPTQLEKAPTPTQLEKAPTPTLEKAPQFEETESISILNPYKNLPYYYRGQIHAHSTRSSDGNYRPARVLRSYKEAYGEADIFVSLTDHEDDVSCRQIFTDPGVPGVSYVPGEEGGGAHHLLEIGLTKSDPCRWPTDFAFRERIAWVEATGGFAAAAHPFLEGHKWTEDDLHSLWIRGLELVGRGGSVDEHAALWDSLLRADRVRWGICTDDTHDGAGNRGWLVVNSEVNYANRFDLVNNLRQGNFYAVCATTPEFGTNWPRFNSIQRLQFFSPVRAGKAAIKVRFSGASRLKFKGRDGDLPCVDPSDPSRRDRCTKDAAGSEYKNHENDDSLINEVTYTLNGSEGYLRIELEHSNGVRAFSQPIFVYGKSPPDCISINYAVARVQESRLANNTVSFDIVDDSSRVLRFRSESAAQKALGILKHYRMSKMCFVGRPSSIMPFTYFLSGGDAPSGSYANEDCVSFNKNDLSIALLRNPQYSFGLSTWKIVEGSIWYWDFGDSEIQAHRAMEILGRHDFSSQCYVDRPIKGEFGMVYLRK